MSPPCEPSSTSLYIFSLFANVAGALNNSGPTNQQRERREPTKNESERQRTYRAMPRGTKCSQTSKCGKPATAERLKAHKPATAERLKAHKPATAERLKAHKPATAERLKAHKPATAERLKAHKPATAGRLGVADQLRLDD